MNKLERILKICMALTVALTLGLSLAVGNGEAPENPESAPAETTVPEEAGYEEVQGLMEAGDVSDTDTEGMNLEEITETYINQMMGEYYNSVTGLNFQYPSDLIFSEENGMAVAQTEDKSEKMIVESIEADGGLTMETLIEAIRMEDSTCEVTQYEQPECARIQRKTEDGMIQTDLYLMSEKWIHHITLIYPQDRQEKYDTGIEYMIHSITSDETDLG